MNHDRAERLEQEIRARMTQARNAAAASPAPGHTGVAEELKKLAELRDAGVLSDEEFQGQKAKLLGS